MNTQIADLLKTYLALSSDDQRRFDQVMALASGRPIVSENADPLSPMPIARPSKPKHVRRLKATSCIIPVARLSQNGVLQAGIEIPVPTRGVGLKVVSPDRLADLRFRQAWRPGVIASVYIGSCEGTARLGRVLNQPLFKAGSHGGENVSERIRGLGKARYGSVFERDGALVAEMGFEHWCLEPLLPPKSPSSAHSPVRFRGNHLSITLPAGMSATLFDQRLAKSLADKSLHSFLWSEAGQAHCLRLDIDPATMIRSTPTCARGRSKSLCNELVILRPRFDTPLLIRLIEEIVFEFVVGSILPHHR